MPLPQILMGRRMRLDVHSVITHVSELLPGNCFAASEFTPANTLGVDEHCQRVTVLLHYRPGDLVLRFPTVIKRDDCRTRRNVFLSASPREKILHANDG